MRSEGTGGKKRGREIEKIGSEEYSNGRVGREQKGDIKEREGGKVEHLGREEKGNGRKGREQKEVR